MLDFMSFMLLAGSHSTSEECGFSRQLMDKCGWSRWWSWLPVAVLSLLVFAVLVFAGAGNFNPSGDSNLSVVPYTHANNTFTNVSWAFLNFTVDNATGVLIDTFNINLSGPQFSSFNGKNTTIWDKDLVLMMHFEEGSGSTTANDSSGYGNHGTLTNMNTTGNSTSGWNVSGRLGTGLLFDGVNDYIITVSSQTLNTTNKSWSASVWFNSSDLEGFKSPLTAGNSNYIVGWSIEGTRFLTRLTNGSDIIINYAAVSGSWNYVAVTNQDELALLKVYLNDNLVETRNYSGFKIKPQAAAVFHIGNAASAEYFNGSIDEVKVWSRTLSAAEVSAEYNRTASNYLTSHSSSGNVHTFSLNMTNLSNGNYSWFAWVNDSASNVAHTQSTPRFLTIDTFAPAISFVASTPANNSYLPTSYIFINTSSNDAGNDHNDYSAFVDFNNSLVGYWRFEDDGDTNATDFSSYGNNGTLVNFQCLELNCNVTGGVGGSGSGWTSAGRRGKGLIFDGNNDYVSAGNSSVLKLNTTVTVEAWVKTASLGTTVDILSSQYWGPPSWGYGLQMYSTNRVLFFIFNTSNAVIQAWSPGDMTLAVGQWTHLVGVYDGATVWLYWNGANVSNIPAPGGISPSPIPLVIGAIGNGGSEFWNGSIDEVKIWNRVLNASEINASFNAGTYRLQNNFTGLNDGNYSYRAFAVDAAGNINGTENRTFMVDTAAPSITFGAATELHNANLSRRWLFVNVTVAETYVKNVSVELWNSTHLVNRTNFSNSQAVLDGSNLTFTINFTAFAPLDAGGVGNLSDGVYRFNATVYDLSENRVALGWRTATVDTTLPMVDFGLNSVVNGTFVDRNWVFLNFSYTELNNHTFMIRNGSTNWTSVNSVLVSGSTGYFYYNFTNLNEGVYSFFGWVNDTAANVNQTLNRTFTVDTTAPVITTVPYTHANATFQNITYSFLNFSVTETNLERFSVNLTGPQFNSFNGKNTTIWDKDLVGVWHFEEMNTSTTANDSSGSGNHGTLFNMNNSNTSDYANVWSGFNSSGYLGGAMAFDGINDYVRVSNSASLNGSVFTASAWVMLASDIKADDSYHSLNKHDTATNRGWWFDNPWASAAVRFTFGNGTGTNGIESGAVPYTVGKWMHLAATYNGTTAVLYVDGVNRGSEAGGFVQAQKDLFIGMNGVTMYGGWNGSIDEVKIWNRALSAAEVSAEYNRTASNYLTSHSSSGNVHTFSLNMTNLTTNGNYSWFAWVNDSASNVAHTQSTRRFLTIDTFAPAISFVANTPANNSYLPTSYIFINTTSNDAGNDHNDYSAFVNFNNSLVGYWRFEDDGDTNASDWTSYNNNGTLVGFGCTLADCNLTGAPGGGGIASGFVSSGRRGKALSFDGENDYVGLGTPSILDLNGSFTMEAWAKFNFKGSGDFRQHIIAKGRLGAGSPFTNLAYTFGITSGNILHFQIYHNTTISSGVTYTPSPDFSNNTWYHFAASWDGTTNTNGLKVYVNGVLVGQSTAATAYIQKSTAQTCIGTDCEYPLGYVNGTIDEVKIWSRALNGTEINASFSAGIYRLSSNFTGLNDGNYSYQAFVVDAAGNINNTENRTFMVDTAAPSIAFGAASELMNANLSRRWLFVNVTVSETYVKNVSIELWNSTHLVNRTNFSNSQAVLDGSNLTFSINFTAFAPLDAGGVGNLSDGVYRFNATVFDLSENRVVLGWRTATVDTTLPMVDFGLNSDANNSFKSVNWVFLNFSYTELNNHTFLIRNGSTNWTNVNAVLVSGSTGYFYYNFTGLNDGNFTAFGWVNDTAGNVNQTLNRTVLIDTTLPGITYGLATELHNANLSRRWLFVNVTVGETYVKNVSIELWNTSATGTGRGLVNRTNFSVGVIDGSNVTFQINFTNLPLQGVGLPDDVYYFNATVYDLSENRVVLGWRTAYIDTTPPLIDYGLNSDANESFVARNWVFMNFSYTELYNNTFLIRNGSTNWTNVNATATYFFYNFTNRGDGNYTFFGQLNDSASNINQTVNRTVVVDLTAPTINAVRLFSNATGSFWVGSNTSSAATVYFNSIAGTAAEIGGGAQWVTVEVDYNDSYRNAIAGNLSFGDSPSNDSKIHPQQVTYSIETGSGNASTLISANDTANNTDTAVITFIRDINDTTTSDNSSSDERYWYTGNVTINLSATDAHSGVNRTYYCIYNVGNYPCTPSGGQFTFANVNIGHVIQVNCSGAGGCQQAVRYYSMDNVSNNESGGANGGSIRESTRIQVNTGTGTVTDTIANNTAILGNAYVSGSNLTNSTIDSCHVTNTWLVRSTVVYNASLPTNCTVSSSTIFDTNVTSSTILNSFIDPSFIYDSYITNSNLTNATVFYSRIENSTTCAPNFNIFSAVVRNNTLLSGTISFNGTNYFSPFPLSAICANLPPSPVGVLTVNQTAFNDNGSILFTYSAPQVGRSVMINTSELAKFDNTSTSSIYFNDNGTYPDNIADDAIYKANYTIGDKNNVSDGTYRIFANVSDNLGNNWRVPVNITIDNTNPNATLSINNGSAQTTDSVVTLRYVINDSGSGVDKCRFANEERVFTPFDACAEGVNFMTWGLSPSNGTKTVIIQVMDAAGNVNETNDTIALSVVEPTVIITPVAGDVIKGVKTIDIAAPSAAVNVSFQIINASRASDVWDLNGVYGAITFDVDLSDGFSQSWRTTNFSNETLFNLTVVSYGATGSQISSDTEGNIQVDNLPPVPTLLFPSGGAVNRVVTVAANSSNDTARVVFEYSNDGANWITLGTDFTNAGGWNITFDSAQFADTTTGRIRVNATDDAGITAASTGSNFEIDNTPPSVTITAPTSGSTVSGKVNITYTIIGTVHGVQVSFDGAAYSSADHSTYHLWDTTAYVDGSHIFRVRANDSLNNTGYSDIQLVVVDNGGANVIILSPGSGGYKSGNVTITVTAPGTTFNVTFNVSNSSVYFNLSAAQNVVTVDNTSAAWEQIWYTNLFAEDTSYNIEVRAYDASNTFLGTDIITGIEVDNQIPVNATNLTIHDTPTDTDGVLNLVWNASTSADIDHYNIHRSQTVNFTAGTGTFVKSVTTATTTDTLSSEGTWFYKVIAVDNVGRESNASNEVNVTIDLAGPTGTLGINKSNVKNNDTIRFTFTGSQTGLAAIVNASEMANLDSLVLEDFETIWETSNSTLLNITLNTTSHQGSFSNEIITNGSALNTNFTIDIGSTTVNLTGRNRLILRVLANTTGTFLNFTFGEGAGNLMQGNFTVNVSTPNVWETKVFDISSINTSDADSVRYLRFNVTTSAPFRMLVDDLRASRQIRLLDDGQGDDATANDAIYTAQYNVSGNNGVSDGLKSIRALVDDGANFLSPLATTTIDNTPPFSNISIAAGAAYTTTTTVVLSLAFSDSTSGVAECHYSNSPTFTSAFEACQEMKSWTLTGVSGVKTVYYEVKDNTGNLNTSSDSITLDVDTPAINITSPVWGTRVNGTVNITFIGVEGATPKVSVDGGNLSFTTTSTYHLLNTINLTEGEHTVVIRDEDAAGNVGESMPLLIIVDNIPALVTIILPLPGSLLTGNVSVIAVITEDARNVSFFLENSTHSHPVFNDTNQADGWNFTLDTGRFASAGGYHINATAQYDVGGALSQGIVTGLEIDNSAPTPTLITPVDNGNYSGTILLNATAPPDTIRVSFEYSPNNGATWIAVGTDFSNISGWAADWNTKEVADGGSYLVRATATDSAGLQASDTNAEAFTIDNTPVTIAITSPTPGTVLNGTVNITFTGGARQPQIRIDGAPLVNADTNNSYLWNTRTVQDGAHTIVINDSDASGNVGVSPVYTYTVDNTPGFVTIITPSASVLFLTGASVVEAASSDNTYYVVFNVSNSTGYFSVAGAAGITNDTVPQDGWRQTVITTNFADGDYNITVYAYDINNSLIDTDNRTIEFDNTAPSSPILTALPEFDTDGTVVLNWSDVGGDVSYYNVYRSTTAGFNVSSGTLVKNLSANLTTDFLAVNARYHYRVTAVDNVGHESISSNEVNTSVQVAGREAVILAGVLGVNDSYVRDGDSLLFTFTGSSTDLNVTVNDTELRRLDNSTTVNLQLNDSGLNSDLVSDDAVYTAVYTISANNNISDGTYIIGGVVNDSANNRFYPKVNITLDNTVPNVSVIINSGDAFTSSRTVSLALAFNDSLSGVSDCRLANENQVFGEWIQCSANLVWTLSSNDAVKAVILEVRDRAGNVNSSNDTITLQTTRATTIVQPLNSSTVMGGQQIIVIAPDDAATVTFRIINGTNTSMVNGTYGETNDTTPADGFRQVWNTSAFADQLYNITAISYTANNVYISNATVMDIEVDNTAPSSPLLTALPTFDTDGVVVLNWSDVGGDVSYYNVYRSTTSGFNISSGTLVKNLSSNSTTDTPGVNARYYYRVTAVDNVAHESVSSNEVNTTVSVAAVFGTLTANDTTVNDGSSILFTLAGTVLDLNVTINATRMRALDNYSGELTLNDSGQNGDAASDDAVYSAVYTINANNNVSDGVKQLTAIVNDSANNRFLANVNITLDNTVPNASVKINSDVAIAIYRLVELEVLVNDSSGIEACRFANEERVFGGWEACASRRTWQLSTSTGNKTVVVQARDFAGNVNETNDTIEFRAAVPLGELTVDKSIVKDGDNITFYYEAVAPGLTVIINTTEMGKLDNTSSVNVKLLDDGNWPDFVSTDGIYTGNYTISVLNNVSDGVKTIIARANDSEGNLFQPKVNITLDNTAPNVSVQIFGTSVAGFTNVSTEYTVSRAVTLITSFNDTVGIDKCRYANENQAYTPWESCISNRAWLLSDGAGNKTVIIDVRDTAGNVNTANDTIFFNATGAGLDITPPLTPTVIDDGTYTNTDVALHAAWNSTDPESELLQVPLEYEYRIRYNGTSDSSIAGFINESFTYVSTVREITVHRMNLTDGNNYTFEVRAVNTAGVRSAIGSSDGIIVDVSAPTIPSLNSTHLEGNWSLNNELRFNWTATDSISNVSAYSYVLDRNSSTVPDSVPESESEHTVLATPFNDGQSSVLKFNSSGNASTVYLEVRQNLSVGDVLRVTVQLAESHFETTDRMGVRVYATNLVPTGFNMTANNISEVADFERNVDYKSDLRDATSYSADVQVNTAVNTGRFFVAIAGSTTDTDNSYNLLIANSNRSYDTSRQSYYCMQTVSCVNTTNTTGYAVTAAKRDMRSDNIWDRSYSNVGDGTFYFHVRAQDKAGNFGPTKHYQALVDRSAPSIPQMILPLQRTSNISQLTFNWTDSTDPESGVGNYSLSVDNNSDFSSPEFYGWVGNITNYTVTQLTADATYYARVHSRNRAGINSSWSDSISLAIDTTPPVITLSKPTGTVATNGITVVLRTNEKAVCSGVEGVGSYATFTFTNSTLHETRVALSSGNGDKTFNVKCADAVNRETTQSWTITVDSTATASSVTLQSPSVFTDELVDTNVTVRTSSGAGLGEVSKGAFSLRIGGNAVPFSVFDSGGGIYALSFRAPLTNGSYSYDVTVSGVQATQSTLKVSNLLFVVQYVEGSISGNKATKMVYTVAGNFSIGMASDSRSVTTTSAAGGINLSANAKDGDVFVFVTRSSGDVERAGDLLKERKFLDAVNPSFGYQIDQETFIVFTDLEYGDIALSGNKTLKAGKYNLVVENKGFDSSLNKTRLEVRVT